MVMASARLRLGIAPSRWFQPRHSMQLELHGKNPCWIRHIHETDPFKKKKQNSHSTRLIPQCLHFLWIMSFKSIESPIDLHIYIYNYICPELWSLKNLIFPDGLSNKTFPEHVPIPQNSSAAGDILTIK